KDRPCTGIKDRRNGSDERTGDGDYFIAGSDPCREQGEVQRAGPAVYSHRMADSTEVSKLLFELRYLLSEDKLPRIEDIRYRGQHLSADGAILRLQIYKGNCHGSKLLCHYATAVWMSAFRRTARPRSFIERLVASS